MDLRLDHIKDFRLDLSNGDRPTNVPLQGLTTEPQQGIYDWTQSRGMDLPMSLYEVLRLDPSNGDGPTNNPLQGLMAGPQQGGWTYQCHSSISYD
ncbi:hypothetical protein CHS0354_005572 [Potamilus streckersoni]|uniref:Uncharacterized protein n=1 Tax=Potamilus streckersoni TaxID=2493646 RepID=A0AAE0VHB9_9BIVA|nr:hypothetical protein CHS0354_005572 [Potamilus streckersoni]